MDNWIAKRCQKRNFSSGRAGAYNVQAWRFQLPSSTCLVLIACQKINKVIHVTNRNFLTKMHLFWPFSTSIMWILNSTSWVLVQFLRCCFVKLKSTRLGILHNYKRLKKFSWKTFKVSGQFLEQTSYDETRPGMGRYKCWYWNNNKCKCFPSRRFITLITYTVGTVGNEV